MVVQLTVVNLLLKITVSVAFLTKLYQTLINICPRVKIGEIVSLKVSLLPYLLLSYSFMRYIFINKG